MRPHPHSFVFLTWSLCASTLDLVDNRCDVTHAPGRVLWAAQASALTQWVLAWLRWGLCWDASGDGVPLFACVVKVSAPLPRHL